MLSSTRFVPPPHRPRRFARASVEPSAPPSSRPWPPPPSGVARRNTRWRRGEGSGASEAVIASELGTEAPAFASAKRPSRPTAVAARVSRRARKRRSRRSRRSRPRCRTSRSRVAGVVAGAVRAPPVDPDAPPLSPAAQKAVDAVDREVRAASLASADLARASAPNAYLPKSAGFSLPLPPEPVRFPRTKLSLRLAVLLLRSGYETVDAMDILPMDQFQVKFWKSRQAEWEPYTFQYAPLVIEQGKLEDPLYFDFISYVQFEVVAREMPKSAGVFEERAGAEGTTRVVRRTRASPTTRFCRRCSRRGWATPSTRGSGTGSRIPRSGCPEPARLGDEFEANAATIEKGVAALTKCMVDKGYGLRSDVAVVDMKQEKRRVRMRIVVEGVANLWGAQALAARGVSPPNEYLGFALTAYCRASGIGSFYASKASDTAVEIELTVTMP